MKKSNVIIIALLLVISFALLALWVVLGFNHVHMLDLWLSIAWWVIAAVAIFTIVRMEQVRKQKLRTAFIADGALFNPEAGVVGFEGKGAVPVIASVLDNLEYSMDQKDMPLMSYRYIVRTNNYSVDDSGKTSWHGEVQLATQGSRPRKFHTRRELERILDQGAVALA